MRKSLHAVLLFCLFISISEAKEIDFIEGTASGLLDNLNSKFHVKEQISFGGGGYGVIGNWVVGGEGFGIIDDKTDFNESAIRGYGLLKVGYVAYANNNTRFFSMLGVGGGDLDFREGRESSDSMLVDMSVGFLFAKISRQTTLAVNLGYLHSVDWHFEEQDIGMSGFYLNVS
ncbi:MAG: hypothetical protein KAI17_28120, partial [Thiotrichaceae bacterium]|nr:hypothetical protein [Thiotrichaceae bacterium]